VLNPLRAALSKTGVDAFERASSFTERTDAELANFRSLRSDLERQVRRGDLTVKVAREQAVAAAEAAKATLKRQAEGYSPTPRNFLDRLIEATDARKKAKDAASLESLQRETNRLLRQSLIEQQVVTRDGEFQGKTFVRPMTGGSAAPTLDGLLDLARSSGESGDEVASEWSRRQLESFRVQVQDPGDLRRIDLACDRPDVVNPRLVQTYLTALEGQPPEALGTFIDQSIESSEANACVASFVLARSNPFGDDPAMARATRKVLANLNQFPDAALTTLRSWEADARDQDAEAAQAQVAFASARFDSESRLPGLEAPTAAEVERLNRIGGKPAAMPGEAIGLTLARRGRMADDIPLEAMNDEPGEVDPAISPVTQFVF